MHQAAAATASTSQSAPGPPDYRSQIIPSGPLQGTSNEQRQQQFQNYPNVPPPLGAQPYPTAPGATLGSHAGQERKRIPSLPGDTEGAAPGGTTNAGAAALPSPPHTQPSTNVGGGDTDALPDFDDLAKRFEKLKKK